MKKFQTPNSVVIFWRVAVPRGIQTLHSLIHIHTTYWVFKYGSQSLKIYNIHWNEQNIPSQHMSNNQCLLTYGWQSCHLQQTVVVVLMLVNTIKSSRKKCVSKILGVSRISTRSCNMSDSFPESPNCQISPEPNFRLTEKRTCRCSQLACTILRT